MSSETTKDVPSVLESIFGIERHKTTITTEDGTKYTGRGITSEESQKNASDNLKKGHTDWP